MAADLTRPSVWLNGLLAFWRHDKTREAVGVLAMAAAVLTLAALATFDPRDPSFWFASGADQQIRNAVGRVGAEAAGDLLGLLGLSALLAPPALFYWGWIWVGGRRLVGAWRRGLGLLLLTPSLSLLATVLHQVNVLPGGRVERPGGDVGDELFRLLAYSFGTFGLAILALTGLALAVICLTERSFVSLLAWPSAGVNWLATRTRAILAGWKARRAASNS